jgi:2,3-bisphosphoglycerate-independent phosphoglycerate mutase
MSLFKTPCVLAILDGLAINPDRRGNAVSAAKKPVLDRLLATCPSTRLTTYGEQVGLPAGQMGNSEVGHLNIGGGRIVKQLLTLIDEAAGEGKIASQPAFLKLTEAVKSKPGAALHCIGLVSRGGVHSSVEHLEAIVSAAAESGVKTILIHAITDGRDRPPTASTEEVGGLIKFIESLAAKTPGLKVAVASVSGRYFAMDRDKRWDRVKRGYDLFTGAYSESGIKTFPNTLAAINAAHESGVTDEFIEPAAIETDIGRPSSIQPGDGVLFFNFRADRMREIVSALIDAAATDSLKGGAGKEFGGFKRAIVPKPLQICTLTQYAEDLPLPELFPPLSVKNHLGQVIANAGLRQLRIAETEKYAHVTYFFNGGSEEASPNEERALIPSNREVATYDKAPEMSARQITDELIRRLENGSTDFVVLNFANCDMVGHTGVFEAARSAVETVDECLGRILACLARLGGSALVTADHGNSDQMVDYLTGATHTFHTTHPVALILVSNDMDPKLYLRPGGALCDIAPTICELLGITQPAEMTGVSLLKR